MGTAADVFMGVCSVEYDAVDLGYTQGGVRCSFKADTNEKTVDQEDAPIDELIIKQTFEVEVPLAEQNLNRFADLFPGATYTTSGTEPNIKEKLVLSGAAGASLLANAKILILKPAGGTANDWVTLHHAIPVPNIEFAYEKDKVRIYNVTFRALKGVNGFVTFGDTTA